MVGFDSEIWSIGSWLAYFIMFMFVLAFGCFIFAIIQAIGQWNKNNHAPRLKVKAVIVGKRADISVSSGDNHSMSSSSTTYYVAFEVESGDRMEFLVPSQEYGMLIESDRGDLEFQGTRYLGFQRIR